MQRINWGAAPYLTNYHFTGKAVLSLGNSLKDTKYKTNQTILKVFGCGDHKKIKVTTLSVLRTSGIEDDSPPVRGVNDSKLSCNIVRARSKIFELAFCNPWEWFFTATLDPAKYNRCDLTTFHSDLSQFIRDYNKKYKLSVKYLLIPELHSDKKSWHMHGFLLGLPPDHLHKFQIGDKMGKKLADKVAKGDSVYNWIPYLRKFGFCDLEPVKNPEACAKYVTKYISKELAHSVTEINAHLYYRSRGLAEAETIARGLFQSGTLGEPSYTGDYASVWWLDFSDELLNELSKSIL